MANRFLGALFVAAVSAQYSTPGGSCSFDSQCSTNNCAGGYCCSSSAYCSGSCSSFSGACSSSTQRYGGDSCSNNAQCFSNNCAGGYCCSSSTYCSGSCTFSGSCSSSSNNNYYGSSSGSAAAGIAVSVVLGLLIPLASLLALCFCMRPVPPQEFTHQCASWKPRAQRSWGVVYAAHACLTLGLLMGLAAPAIPWLLDLNAVSPFTVLTPGAIVMYVALIFFIFPAAVMSFAAAWHLRALTVGGVMPPVSCCAPSTPALQGLAWVGALVFFYAAIADWVLSASAVYFFYYYSGASPGGALAGAAFVFLLIGAILTSVAGCCCVGSMPGIGRSATCCCCVEQLAARNDDTFSSITPPQPVLVVGMNRDDMTLRTMAPANVVVAASSGSV